LISETGDEVNEEKKQLWTLKHETGRGNRQFIIQPNVAYILHEDHKKRCYCDIKRYGTGGDMGEIKWRRKKR